jgi:hypothetical protein
MLQLGIIQVDLLGNDFAEPAAVDMLLHQLTFRGWDHRGNVPQFFGDQSELPWSPF